jgi:DNA-binding GntR family transcriptional regulator
MRLVRRTLGKKYGVSVIPITEALHRLETDGLVESVPNVGTRVRELSLEAIMSDWVMREALEVQASRICAEKLTEQQLVHLVYLAGRIDELMAQRDPDFQEALIKHRDFHLLIAEYTGYPILLKEITRHWMRHTMMFIGLSSSMFPVPPDWHHQLINAIASRNPEQADRKTREHILYGKEHYCEVIQEYNRRLTDTTTTKNKKGGNT